LARSRAASVVSSLTLISIIAKSLTKPKQNHPSTPAFSHSHKYDLVPREILAPNIEALHGKELTMMISVG